MIELGKSTFDWLRISTRHAQTHPFFAFVTARYAEERLQIVKVNINVLVAQTDERSASMCFISWFLSASC
jgi:hypothetical protein